MVASAHLTTKFPDDPLMYHLPSSTRKEWGTAKPVTNT